ncbi:MAG TPA: glycosyltransferase 87 family protein [Candidatus Limnocylindrales bacterium]|nr:glycosyltransferase 87 family protein [Candidatus Limnocylindrales bacterium]
MPSACTARYAYPLWTAVVLAPFGALPLELAATLWIAVGIGAAVGGTALAWHAVRGPRRGAALLGALLVSSQPFWVLLVGGQMTGLLLGLSGLLAWTASQQRQVTGGLSLALLLVKPQLVAVLAPVLVVGAATRRAVRAVVAFGAAAAVLVALPFALEPGWLSGWLPEVTGRATELAPRLATLWGLAADLFGHPGWGIPLAAGLVIALWWLLRGAAVRPAEAVALALALSVALAPHAWSYDHLVLVVPWAAALAAALPLRGWRRAALLGGVVATASPLPWTLYAVAFARGADTLSVAVPVATMAVLALALRARTSLRRDRRRPLR